jgi:hypothetical protein
VHSTTQAALLFVYLQDKVVVCWVVVPADIQRRTGDSFMTATPLSIPAAVTIEQVALLLIYLLGILLTLV